MSKNIDTTNVFPFPKPTGIEAAMLRHPAGGIGVSSATHKASSQAGLQSIVHFGHRPFPSFSSPGDDPDVEHEE